MPKRVRITDESLNSYGFWIKTSGIDTSDFLKNPLMLWNHSRAWRGTEDEVLPIGVWKDLEVSGAEMSAIPDIDKDDLFSSRIAKKFEKGHIVAASIGVQILEWSDDPSFLKAGQTRPTVTKCKLREVSLVDIPSNKNALVLYDQDGELVNLSDEGSLQKLPTLLSPPTTEMDDLKTLAAVLGLPQTATLADVQAKIAALQSLAAENFTLKADLKKFEEAQAESRKAEVKSLLDDAVADNRIPQGSRGTYEKLFDADFESTKAAVEALPKVVKLSEVASAGSPGGGLGKFTYDGKSFSELSRENPGVLSSLKENDIETFKRLYKAEFGKDYKETVR